MSVPENGNASAADGVNWNRRVWVLAWPLMVSNVTQPLVGLADTAVVGHLDHAYFIGAVALGSLIFSYIYWGFGFLRMGTTGLTAQAYGAEKSDEVKATLARALLMAALFGFLCILLRGVAIDFALWLLGASENVETHARTYIEIRVLSAPGALANIAILGWFYGMQNTRAGLIQQLIINGTNIGLNFLFVFGFGWEVAGVAWASVVSEYLGLVVAAVLVLNMLRKVDGRFRWILIKDRMRFKAMMVLNVDIFIRTVCLLTGSAFFLNIGAGFGELVLAANAVLMNFQAISAHALDGFAHAAEAMIGRAIGARDRKELSQAVKYSTVWAGIFALAFVAVFALTYDLLIALMTNIEAVKETARTYVIWAIIAPFISVWAFQFDGIFLGATRSGEMRNGMIVSLAIFVAVTYLIIPYLSNHGLWLAYLIFVSMRAVTLAARYGKVRAMAEAPQ